jgi:N-acetylneuraminate synthase
MTRVLVVAEAGVNHNGSVDLALRLADAATDAGADAVKFQSFHAEQVISRTAPKAQYQLATTGAAESQLAMARRLQLGEGDHVRIADHCRARGIEFMSTPFDAGSVALLQRLGARRLKIASGEITNAPLLLQVARTGLPIVLSTGMSTLQEVREALQVIAVGYAGKGEPNRSALSEALDGPANGDRLQTKVTLLHCTTEYPSSPAEANLRAMDTLRAEFGLPVGLSDHTPGFIVSVAAAARGACMIEKHLTLDRTMDGPDHRASLEPPEFAAMVAAVREVESALGSPEKTPTPGESKNRIIARRSLVALRDIAPGELFNEQNLGAKRPGTGLPPILYWELLGQPASRAYRADELIDPVAPQDHAP